MPRRLFVLLSIALGALVLAIPAAPALVSRQRLRS
jgi:hypothetical protein